MTKLPSSASGTAKAKKTAKKDMTLKRLEGIIAGVERLFMLRKERDLVKVEYLDPIFDMTFEMTFYACIDGETKEERMSYVVDEASSNMVNAYRKVNGKKHYLIRDTYIYDMDDQLCKRMMKHIMSLPEFLEFEDLIASIEKQGWSIELNPDMRIQNSEMSYTIYDNSIEVVNIAEQEKKGLAQKLSHMKKTLIENGYKVTKP